jgi:hypothetical protein
MISLLVILSLALTCTRASPEVDGEVEFLAVGDSEWTCEAVRHSGTPRGSLHSLALSPMLGATWASDDALRFRLETPQGFLEEEFVVDGGVAGETGSVAVVTVRAPVVGRHRVCLLDPPTPGRRGQRRSFLLTSTLVQEASDEEVAKVEALRANDAAELDRLQAEADARRQRFRDASERQAKAGKRDPLSRGLGEPVDVYLMRTELYEREAAAMDAVLDHLMVNADTDKKKEL